MAAPLVEELKVLEKDGVRAYDAFLRQQVLVIAPVLCIICDNYRASEVTKQPWTWFSDVLQDMYGTLECI